MTIDETFGRMVSSRLERVIARWKTTKKEIKMKYRKGQRVVYRGKEWTVCEGGFSDRSRKVFRYKLSRGAWKEHVPGNCIRELV